MTLQEELDAFDVESASLALKGEMPYDPRPYQWLAYKKTEQEIRDYLDPFIVRAAVSAGKSLMIAMVAKRIHEMGLNPNVPEDRRPRALILARQGEIVSQDSDELTSFGVPNSIMSAGLSRKSAYFPIVCGSEQTVVNELASGKQMADAVFRYIMIDECHQVNVDDIISSMRAVKPRSEEEMFKFDSMASGEIPEEELAETNYEEMRSAKRASMTIIIRELDRRCRERYGRPIVVIGYTGTDFRGSRPIINTDLETEGFWRKKIIDIDTDYLVENGFVVPTVFGHDTEGYDLSEFKTRGQQGDDEFTEAELLAMQEKINKSKTKTKQIIDDVVRRTASRNAVLITCAGKKHCEDAAACLPEGSTFAIVTDSMGKKKREQILEAAKRNEVKYIFQIGCLTTGVNVPPWDTIVIMRRIGSVTLFEQLIGRGMRLLKNMHEKMGMIKRDNLVLDYAGTMDDLSDAYFSKTLSDYVYQTARKSSGDLPCPLCNFINKKSARRCMGHKNGVRCEHLFQFRLCKDIHVIGKPAERGCGHKNDITARYCVKCGTTMIDPDKNLSTNVYVHGDYHDVLEFSVETTKNGEGIAVRYLLQKNGTEEPFTAWEIHYPHSEHKQVTGRWRNKFLVDHVPEPNMRKKLAFSKSIKNILGNAAMINAPVKVTHRKTNNGDVITHKLFDEEF